MEKNNISVTRNIAQTVEMTMEADGYILRAEVNTREGQLLSVSNGSISVAVAEGEDVPMGGEYRGAFNASGEGYVSVSIQGVTDPAERIAIYSAAESYVASAREYYTE